ncbi:MAG: ParB/RepB/Spo0J family partition protein [Oscillospiraceae bacterium]|nr:ParB/RepB/Spo0J family partition protein [Oscillospiraceae bacterium]
MQALRSRPGVRRGGILYLRTDEIGASPVQPRKSFDEDALRELSESIRSYGVLNPLTVRLRGGRYELVAGERRLRAAKLAGLREVPCILVDVSMEDASLIALVENLQRKDLDFVEEANGIRQLIMTFGMRQEEAARRIGKSQSAVANKLRLLRLTPDVLDALLANGLSERHGRALLRLTGADAQRAALRHIIENDLNVAATDAYIDALLREPEEQPDDPEEEAAEGRKEGPRRALILKDVRVFLNSLTRSIDVMKQGGIDADLSREETADALILTISIPKARAAQGAQT